jgi:multiple sugar transport system substrate-binding protein
MAIVGPWAVSVYEDVNWGAVPVPTKEGISAEETWTFSDAKNIGLYTACKNQATAWDVLKFSTSVEQDGQLLELSHRARTPCRCCRPSVTRGRAR